jgi:hypothetical protein
MIVETKRVCDGLFNEPWSTIFSIQIPIKSILEKSLNATNTQNLHFRMALHRHGTEPGITE